MPFTNIAPPETATNKSGISFSLSIAKKTSTARISLTAAAQLELFGSSIIGEKFSAQVGRGADEGRLLIRRDGNGDLIAKQSMHGSASIKMKAWDLLPKSKMPAMSIETIGSHEGGLLFQLPPWASPSGVGGKLEQEFALNKDQRGK